MVENNKNFIKKLADITLQEKSINRTLPMNFQEQSKTIFELEVKLLFLNATEARIEKKVEGNEEQRYVLEKIGRQRYVETVSANYSSILYEI